MEICIDFDGSCVTHEYPKVGRDIGAAMVLKRLTDAGHRLILFTMRSGKEQTDAENWFAKNDIPLYGSNTNPTQKNWTASPKAYGQLYLDDAALGIPLINNGIDRPYIDWVRVEIMLEDKGILSKTKTIFDRFNCLSSVTNDDELIKKYKALNDDDIIEIIDDNKVFTVNVSEFKEIVKEEARLIHIKKIEDNDNRGN